MLSVAEALVQITDVVSVLPSETQNLSDSLGLVLAESVVADVDSPPFDKALMDGYAVRATDVRADGSELDVIEEVTAGRVPQREVTDGTATRIMTGAPLPAGADAVVRIEDTEMAASGEAIGASRVRIRVGPLRVGQNIMPRGKSMAAGTQVLPIGRMLRAQELAALAEMGRSQIAVFRHPEVAVLATGDELVPVSVVPGPGQIRNSNETMLTAQIQQAGGIARPLGVARDEREHLGRLIRQGLQSDVLLLSGGVSAGKLDLVPSELASAGVEQIFHQVNVKPGKPLWFGVLRRPERPCFVFGLPGNPVSSMVCFELFVRTALRRLMGVATPEPLRLKATLQHAHRHKDDRETYFPCAIEQTSVGRNVRLMNWHGSSDLQSTVDANGMAMLPGCPRDYVAGDEIDVICW